MGLTTQDPPRRRTIATGPSLPVADDAVFRLSDVIRVYREADVETIALRGVDLTVERGELVAIMGRSGSGKSTLLNLLAGSDRPTAGRVLFLGRDLATMDDAARAAVRGREIGIVYQSQNLAPMLSLLENVRLAAWLAGRPIDGAAARSALERVGLGHRAGHRPAQLSGGEQQRAALTCVLAGRPTVLLADEITGELDSESAGVVLQILQDVHAAEGTTIVLVTHDDAVAGRADRIVELRDGRIVADGSTN
ncbi:MAG TPA: ABC transporter ATP-binding protein [Candidatus Limnocylindrales bacterium]|nr:ABC transporter ATP-binding protein [Candidatus Limnocylindrales bacterium]